MKRRRAMISCRNEIILTTFELNKLNLKQFLFTGGLENLQKCSILRTVLWWTARQVVAGLCIKTKQCKWQQSRPWTKTNSHWKPKTIGNCWCWRWWCHFGLTAGAINCRQNAGSWNRIVWQRSYQLTQNLKQHRTECN